MSTAAPAAPPTAVHAAQKPLTLPALLRFTLEHDASDLHLTAGERPWVRIHGKMHALGALQPSARTR